VALQAAGRVILLDLGAGTLRALLNVGLDFTRLDIIGLSHFHIDHVGDLAPFLFATHYSAVVYSGDTDWSDSLIRLASGADLLILEAANPTKIPGHLTPAEAGRLAARTGVPRLVLTHFYPPCDQMDVVAACAQEYSGEIIRAEDGLRLKV